MEIQTTLNCAGRLLTLDSPRIMGILNVTPDSFFDGGRYTDTEAIVTHVGRMLSEGADIIDVGGMSSRPGADLVPVETELERVLPAIEAIRSAFPGALISIDTIRAAVARRAIAAGAALINDISAGSFDDQMYAAVATLGVPYILMHMQGTPRTMQTDPQYDDVVLDVLDFFLQEIGKLRELGVVDIVLDPGFGFGKSVIHNYRLLKHLQDFGTVTGLPVLAGVSRKSMINKILGTRPEEALNGTSVLHVFALQNGARLLRVHDVKEAKQVVQLWQQLNSV